MKKNFFDFFSIVTMYSVWNIIYNIKYYNEFCFKYYFSPIYCFRCCIIFKTENICKDIVYEILFASHSPILKSQFIQTIPSLELLFFSVFLIKKIYIIHERYKRKKTYRKNDFQRKWLYTGSALQLYYWEALIKKKCICCTDNNMHTLKVSCQITDAIYRTRNFISQFLGPQKKLWEI